MRIIPTIAAKVALALGVAFCLTSAPALAQLKIGLRVAPLIAYGRVQDQTKRDLATPVNGSQDIKHTGDAATVSFSGGIIFDYFFKPNYAFGTGIYYTVKRASVDAGPLGKADWNLQQIQIPVTIKLYTNEIAPDFKLYFQLGGALDFAIAQKLNKFESDDPSIEEPDGTPLRPIDVSIILGSGVEYRIAESTTLFAGFSYNRGLLNLNNKKGLVNEGGQDLSAVSQALNNRETSSEHYGVRVDVVALDLGIKF